MLYSVILVDVSPLNSKILPDTAFIPLSVQDYHKSIPEKNIRSFELKTQPVA